MLPETLNEEPTLKALDAQFPEAIVEASQALGETTLIVRPDTLTAMCTALKSNFGFNRLSAVTAVDWWPVEPRFEVVYHLHDLRTQQRLRIKLRVAEGDVVDSVTPIWKTANWYEREVFDLFGIGFRDHPNLERIMMPADWEGHPLRKDYPVHGYKYSYSEEG
ncbi:MAG TPA: NADH-quinone oxidoreductase subunit C [Bryobacteraceae bacterium]|nr:NADH-quinone oxidoreductase subunit C [Bryobacteraceae bacterium]